MHNFSSLLNITLHVSDGLSVHRQEFKTVHTASGICHTGSVTACWRAQDGTYFHLRPTSKQSQNLYDIYLTLYVQSWAPDDGRKDHPKHVE